MELVGKLKDLIKDNPVVSVLVICLGIAIARYFQPDFEVPQIVWVVAGALGLGFLERDVKKVQKDLRDK